MSGLRDVLGMTTASEATFPPNLVAAESEGDLIHLVVVLRDDQLDRIADRVVEKLRGAVGPEG